MLEPRFNADTLANLLSIPLNKSLIRKHVSSQFSTLLGDACQRQKDMTQRTSDFVPLNGSDKHKVLHCFMCEYQANLSELMNFYSPWNHSKIVALETIPNNFNVRSKSCRVQKVQMWCVARFVTVCTI